MIRDRAGQETEPGKFQTSPQKKFYLRYLAGMLLFGSNGIIASHIPLSSTEIVFLRTVLGGAFLLALFLLTGQRFTVRGQKRDTLFIALSGVAMAADWLLLFEAFQRIGVSLSILINYTGPAITVVLAFFVFREKVTRPKALALGAALLGAVLINGTASGQMTSSGLICAVLSAFAYALMVILNKCARTIKGMENATLQLLSAAVVVTVYMGFRQGLALSIPGSTWPWILWLGLVNTGIGCYFYFSSIGALPTQSVAILGYLEPFSAVFFSLLFLGERLSALQWLGAALILGGAVAGEAKKSQQAA